MKVPRLSIKLLGSPFIHTTTIALICVFQLGCHTLKPAPTSALESVHSPQKLPPPQALQTSVTEAALNPFEKQFRKDTGESGLTKRVEIDQPTRALAAGKERLAFKFDLSAWPENARAVARLWIAVGAAGALSSEGPLGVSFAQNGVGMATQIDNTFNVDGVMLLGTDFALADGEVTLEIDRLGHPPGTAYTVHAIVYLPRKNDPSVSKEK